MREFVAFSLWSGMAAAQVVAPDVILHNAKIVTVNGRFELAQALAISGERIGAVGTNREVLALAGPNTRRIDLRGSTVLPGLIDSHTHAVDAALFEFDHPVPDMETIADVLAYVRARAKVVPEGEWIFVSQVFITRLREQRFPTRAELDQAAPRHAVYFRTGPDAALNSLALARAGIARGYKITDGRPGRIETDAAGEPNGILRNCARLIPYKSSGRAPTVAEKAAQLAKLIADYNANGITSFCDRNAGDDDIAVYRHLLDSGGLSARVFLNLSVDGEASLEEIRKRIDAAAAHPLHTYSNRLWLRGIKMFLDGGMLTGSAYMREPWGVSKVYSITDSSYRGMRYIEPDKLYQAVRYAMEKKLQPTAHSVGDGAVHALVDAYERVNASGMAVREHRPCVTHSNFMSPSSVEKMAALGIVADLQPAWLERDGATLIKQFGYARLAYFQPYKALEEAGVVVGGGSDHMQMIGSMRSINPYNPFFGMWIMLERRPRWTDTVLHPEQRVSRQQAIRFYTIQNAFLTFEEKEKGSLETGKLADLIVLDRDLLTCPVSQVKDAQVLETWLGGKQVFIRR